MFLLKNSSVNKTLSFFSLRYFSNISAKYKAFSKIPVITDEDFKIQLQLNKESQEVKDCYPSDIDVSKLKEPIKPYDIPLSIKDKYPFDLIVIGSRFGEAVLKDLYENVTDLKTWLNYIPTQSDFNKIPFKKNGYWYEKIFTEFFESTDDFNKKWLKNEYDEIINNKRVYKYKTHKYRKRIFENLPQDKFYEKLIFEMITLDGKNGTFLCHPLLYATLDSMIKDEKFKHALYFIDNFIERMEVYYGHKDLNVISARNLTTPEKNILIEFAKKLFKKNIIHLKLVVDKSQVSGFTILIDNVFVELSAAMFIKNERDKFLENMVNRAVKC